jgi:CRISPR-associated endonuclease Csn1
MNSVGFAAVDDHYRLLRAKGNNILGVRLFNPAKTAEERRDFRTTRRRLSRRRWRLRALNEVFASELAKVDANFLPRLKYAWVHPADQQNKGKYSAAPLFDDVALDHQFHETYPTIYHLRLKLMTDTKQHDLREVYLAIHHIIKFRGNFLRGEGPINASAAFDINTFIGQMAAFYDQAFPDFKIVDLVDQQVIFKGLTNMTLSPTDRANMALMGFNNAAQQPNKRIFKAILSALVGNQVDLMAIFQLAGIPKEDQKDFKFKFTDNDLEEKLAAFGDNPALSDEQREFLTTLYTAFSGLTLKSLLGDATSVSAAMVARYNSHRNDWAYIKSHVLTPANNRTLRLAYADLMTDNEDLRSKAGKKFAKAIEAADIPAAKKMEFSLKIDNNEFLPRQRTQANGTIPHQLHLNELQQIIENQGQYYPFLKATFEQDGQTLNRIEGLVTFRVPYYVGPLVPKYKVVGNNANHWMVPKESGAITPWNYTEKVDRDKSGNEFIRRMTGTDAYLLGEPTLPKNSLVYQEFNVLQELNNLRIEKHRLAVDVKQDIFEHVFKANKTVTVKRIEEYLTTEFGSPVTLSSFANGNERKLNSSLSTYHYFVGIFGAEFVDDPKNLTLLEQIVELQTVFEDRKALQRQLKLRPELSGKQVKQLARTHYTGWGRLSQKLLTSKIVHVALEGEREPGQYSILETLYSTQMNFMEIVNDMKDRYGVKAWLDQENSGAENNLSLKQRILDMPGPKNIKRGINQAFHIIAEITRAVGNEPNRIYLGFTQESQPAILTNARVNHLQQLYSQPALKKEYADFVTDLKTITKEELADDRLYLYYLQQGKDIYTGQAIDLEKLASDYQIDHIIPKAYVKNNSLANRVLVHTKITARQPNSPMLKPAIIAARKDWWQQLKALGLMSTGKFNSLTTKMQDFSADQKERFMAQSLVDNHPMNQNVAALIRAYYRDVKVEILPSELTADMRRYLGIRKNQVINDYHHAHDALLLTIVGEFSRKVGITEKGRVSAAAGAIYSRYTNASMQHTQAKTGQSQAAWLFTFIVGSMANPNIQFQTNQTTGEIVWTGADEAYLQQVMDYKKMLVTKMTLNQTGPLYNATRYGRGDKHVAVALSQDKVADLYGGFGSLKPAYAALVYAKKKFRLVNVLRLWLPEIKKDASVLEKKVQTVLGDDQAKIIRAHVPYGQLLLKDGALVTVSSATELHNFRQLWLPRVDYQDISVLLGAPDKDTAENRLQIESHFDGVDQRFESLLRDVIDQAQKNYPLKTHQTSLEKLIDKIDQFNELEFAQKQQVFSRLLSALHANAASGDLKQIGLTASWGRLIYPKGVTLSDRDKLIDSSFTGLFNTVERIETLRDI